MGELIEPCPEETSRSWGIAPSKRELRRIIEQPPQNGFYNQLAMLENLVTAGYPERITRKNLPHVTPEEIIDGRWRGRNAQIGRLKTMRKETGTNAEQTLIIDITSLRIEQAIKLRNAEYEEESIKLWGDKFSSETSDQSEQTNQPYSETMQGAILLNGKGKVIMRKPKEIAEPFDYSKQTAGYL